MSKARKYYGIFRMAKEAPAAQVLSGGIIQMNVNNGTDRTVLEAAHETVFTKKKDAIAELSKAPYPEMLTIVEFYLILKK